MCFETTKTARAKIAKTDIECWKFVTKDYKPWFVGTHGSTLRYDSNIVMPKVKIRKFNRTYRTDTAGINEGYHSFKNYHQCKCCSPSYGYIICKFIISKGTHYFENENEYVSETIMLIETT